MELRNDTLSVERLCRECTRQAWGGKGNASRRRRVWCSSAARLSASLLETTRATLNYSHAERCVGAGGSLLGGSPDHIFLQPLRNVAHRSKQITIDDYLGEAGSVRATQLPASSFPEIAKTKIRRILACSQARFTRTTVLTLIRVLSHFPST